MLEPGQDALRSPCNAAAASGAGETAVRRDAGRGDERNPIPRALCWGLRSFKMPSARASREELGCISPTLVVGLRPQQRRRRRQHAAGAQRGLMDIGAALGRERPSAGLGYQHEEDPRCWRWAPGPALAPRRGGQRAWRPWHALPIIHSLAKHLQLFVCLGRNNSLALPSRQSCPDPQGQPPLGNGGASHQAALWSCPRSCQLLFLWEEEGRGPRQSPGRAQLHLHPPAEGSCG